jgi:hypothetical protein
MAEDSAVFVDFAQIPLGFVTDQDIYDDNGTKLLAAQCPLNETIREQVLARGVSAISLPAACAKKIPSNRRVLKPKAKETRSLSDQRVDRSGEDVSEERAARFHKKAQATLKAIANVGSKIEFVNSKIASEIAELPGDITNMLLEDADQAITTLQYSNDSSQLATRMWLSWAWRGFCMTSVCS